MNKYTDKNVIIELESLIETTIEDHDLRLLLIGFIHKNKFEFISDSSYSIKSVYNIATFTQFLFSISLIKQIDDLNWDFLCYIYNNLCHMYKINFLNLTMKNYLTS